MKHTFMLIIVFSLLAMTMMSCGAREEPGSRSDKNYTGSGTLNPMNDPNGVREFLSEHHIANGDIYLKEGKVYINIVGLNNEVNRLLADRYKAGTYQTVNVTHSIEELQEAQQKLFSLGLFDKLNLYSSELDTLNNRIIITMPDANEAEVRLEIEQSIDPELLSFVIQKADVDVNPGIVGYVTKIDNQSALVVNPTSRKLNETRTEYYDAIWVSNIPSNIEVGQNVNVWFKGEIATSYPGQGTASKITISETQKPVKALLTREEAIRKALQDKDIANINILVVKDVSYDEKSAMWTIRYKSAVITDGVLEEHTIQIPDK
ncbi:DUF3221 domain-containing protein [Paenibacillus sp. OV219]|uniref:DUF3221 domain-containing protein n=1 Tax=Paenibacillus sp. OV219 TaxID=1884377 RepID=UPI0008D72A58|nr:DUF3221 domain-containing protein [Paenibacillus sp. OV219]SEO95341.1 Protein of unknown function [Paenibacillus sp. OV219]